MFTGIVQSMGIVRAIRRGSGGARLALEAPDLPRPIADGASICVSGVCLTVTESDPSLLSFDVVQETLSRSTLGELAVGDRVNLEPSLRVGDGLDGHLVQGHVDGTARVKEVRRGDDGHRMTFLADPDLMAYVIPKGSVAIDGVSLTIAATGDDTFDVALIPTTLGRTTLGARRAGDRVNVETDIIARTVVTTLQRWRTAPEAGGLTMEMLRENGW